MIKLLRYLKGYIKESVIAPLFKFLEACFELIVPVIMAKIIDVGIKNGDTGYILGMGGVLVGLGVLGLAAALTAQYFAAKASVGFGTALRTALFKHINSLSHAEIDKIGTPSLLNRMTGDVNQAQTGVNMFLRLFLRSPFIVVGAIVMCLMINVKLTLIFGVAAPLIGLVIYLVMHSTIPKYRQIQNRLDRVSLQTRENLSGVRVIRAFSRQDGELSQFNASAGELMSAQVKTGRISALLNPLTYVIVNLAIIAIIWFGGQTVYEGDLTQGEVIALVNYMTQILTALIYLANLIIILTKASASAVRVNEVFAVHSSISDGELAEAKAEKNVPAVELRDVTFAYGGANPSLEKISFSVFPGETVGIVGGTGSGKSTLVNLIPRFYDVTSGAVLVNGNDVREYKLDALRGKIGYVPQRAALLSGTIRDNMKMGNAGASDEEIWRALEVAQAKEFVEQKPDGLDALISQGGKNLSGGQRQRLTIARAVVKNPEILILDDSASALDFATDAALRKALSKLSVTVFIVSQRAAGVKHADKIVVLEDGEAVAIGTHAELFESCPQYREICLSQMSEKEAQNG